MANTPDALFDEEPVVPRRPAPPVIRTTELGEIALRRIITGLQREHPELHMPTFERITPGEGRL